MPRRIVNQLILLIIPFIFLGCDGGLAPSQPVSGVTGFSGKITFTGTWPGGIKRTHLIVFKNPILTVNDFSIINLGAISDSITYGSAEINYNSIDNFSVNLFKLVPGNYYYLIVAQSKTQYLSFSRQDWTVAGVYYTGNNYTAPGVLTIVDNKMTTGINIICDFNNPPPQPPGGQ